MKSIKMKIGILVLLCVLLVSLIIGTASIQSAKKVVERDSSLLMESMCKEKTETLEALLSRISQSVQTLYGYAEAELTDIKRFQTDPIYVKDYTQKLDKATLNAANNTEGAMTAYIRFNPEFTEPTSGLFYSKSSASGSFEKLVPTDFSMYDPGDTAHVGWYYIPVQNGKPTWMSPYVNENLGVEMVSYVIPLKVDGVDVGIIGMDIDFSVITDVVDNTQIYQSGYAFLTDQNGESVYVPKAASIGDKGWKRVDAALSNALNLSLTAPIKEIQADADVLMKKIGLIVLASAVVTLLASSVMIRGIVKPLGDLNRVAGEIADGRLDVEITCKSKDEVGALAVSFGRTVEQLRRYLACIQETAGALYRLSKGNLAVELKEDYIGEFARIKEALITICDSLNRDFEEIQKSSAQISSGSKMVAEGAQLLSQGTSDQSDAVDELYIIMEGMSNKAKSNAQGARTVQDLADQASQSLRNTGNEMIHVVESMDQISHSGNQIISMTRIIDDIAMQINILALNASIEAARAGEYGKGFSVVAEEVKTLAVRTTETAKGISDLLKNAVTAIEDGKNMTYAAKEAVLAGAEGAASVSQIVEKIVNDCEEQANQTVQALENVNQISAVALQASATSKEEAEASDRLSGQAVMLRELTDRFHLKTQ